MDSNFEEENLLQRLGISFDNSEDRKVVFAGINALAKAFRVSPDAINGDDVLFKTIKSPFLSEVNALDIVLSVEEAMGRFAPTDSNRTLTDIYLVRVGDWLIRLVEAFRMVR